MDAKKEATTRGAASLENWTLTPEEAAGLERILASGGARLRIRPRSLPAWGGLATNDFECGPEELE